MPHVDNSHIVLKPECTVFEGPDAILLFKAMTLRSALKLHLRTGMFPTRGMNITRMLGLVSGFTGKKYTTRQREQAYDDLHNWVETMKAAMPIEK